MSFVSPILDHDLLHRIGWVLFHSLWQGALIGAGFLALSRVLRRQSAQARYLAGCLALALLAAGPALTFMFYSGRHSAIEHSAELISFSAPRVSAIQSASTGAPAASALPDWLTSAAEQLSQLTPWLALGWAAGVLVFGARLARGLWWLRKLQSTAHEPVQREWLVSLNRLRVRFGISRPVRLVKSALVEVPTVVGWLRPVILLPASSILGLTPAQLEAILAHELAHVRRFDYIVNAAQCLLETLMFYHPVVWWISGQVREEREHCCDDLVVEICGNKLAYARALAALEELRGDAPQFAFAANGGTLLNRIRRLMGASSESGISATRQTGSLALIGTGLLLILIGVLLHLGVPRYQAVARVKLAGLEPTNHTSANASHFDPYCLENEVESIQSEPVLRKVIDDLGLTAKWASKQHGLLKNRESLAQIRSMLTIRPIRNTSFLEIRTLNPDPAEARDIANGVARAYQGYSAEGSFRPKEQELRRLQLRAEEHRQKTAAVQERVDELFLKLPVQETGNGTFTTANAESFRKVQGLRIETEAQVMREETLLDGLKKLPPETLAEALPTAAPDTLLVSLLEQNNLVEQKLKLVQKDFGPEHPEVIKAIDQREHIRTKTQQRVQGIMIGLEERVKALKQGLERLQSESAKFREQELETIRATRPYYKAKRELEELERAGETINADLAAARERMSSTSSWVEIMDTAELPGRSVSPNRPKATACILLGVLLNVLGVMMLRNKPLLTLHPAAAAA